MLRDTEHKLFGAIDLLESALNDRCQGADPGPKVSRARLLLQEAISHERKVVHGDTEHPHNRTQAG